MQLSLFLPMSSERGKLLHTNELSTHRTSTSVVVTFWKTPLRVLRRRLVRCLERRKRESLHFAITNSNTLVCFSCPSFLFFFFLLRASSWLLNVNGCQRLGQSSSLLIRMVWSLWNEVGVYTFPTILEHREGAKISLYMFFRLSTDPPLPRGMIETVRVKKFQ